jgi:hypothetical protein
MLHVLLSMLISWIIVGCGPHYVDYFPYHDDGTLKPRVALIPILDSSHSGLPWNLSEELTQAVRYELMDSGQLYLLSPQELSPALVKAENADFFIPDMSFTNYFTHADFIVALELIEHSAGPYEKEKVVSAHVPCPTGNVMLMMKMRIKVIDVRTETPRVVLYEILNSDHVVVNPTQDYDDISWSEEGYPKIPFGKAHQRMIREVACRLEAVTWSAR